MGVFGGETERRAELVLCLSSTVVASDGASATHMQLVNALVEHWRVQSSVRPVRRSASSPYNREKESAPVMEEVFEDEEEGDLGMGQAR